MTDSIGKIILGTASVTCAAYWGVYAWRAYHYNEMFPPSFGVKQYAYSSSAVFASASALMTYGGVQLISEGVKELRS